MPETDVFLQTSVDKTPERVSIQVGGVRLAIHSSSAKVLEWARSTFPAYATGSAVQSRVVLRMLAPSQWRKARSEASARSRLGATELPLFQDCGDFVISFHDGDHLVLSEEKPGHDVPELMSRVLARVLPRHGSILIHAAGIARDSKGYLFFGPRGAGKSTAVALIADSDPEARILGDDVVIVHAAEWGSPTIHTAPFGCRYTRLAPPPSQIALDSAYRLVQDDRTRIDALAPGEGLRFLREAAEPAAGELLYDGALEERVQRILSRVCQSTGSGVRQLRFHRSAEFWKGVRA